MIEVHRTHHGKVTHTFFEWQLGKLQSWTKLLPVTRSKHEIVFSFFFSVLFKMVVNTHYHTRDKGGMRRHSDIFVNTIAHELNQKLFYWSLKRNCGTKKGINNVVGRLTTKFCTLLTMHYFEINNMDTTDGGCWCSSVTSWCPASVLCQFT